MKITLDVSHIVDALKNNHKGLLSEDQLKKAVKRYFEELIEDPYQHFPQDVSIWLEEDMYPGRESEETTLGEFIDNDFEGL